MRTVPMAGKDRSNGGSGGEHVVTNGADDRRESSSNPTGNRADIEPVTPTDDGGGGGTLVGVAATDGTLLAADSRTSQGELVRGKTLRKVVPVHPTAAIGSTDDLGRSQAVISQIRAEVNRYEMQHGTPMPLAALKRDAAQELARRATGEYLLGGVDDGVAHVYTLDRSGGTLEHAFVAIGSGRDVATGVLEDVGTRALALAEARRVVGRAMQAALERDGATGGELQLAEITDDGVEVTTVNSIEELH